MSINLDRVVLKLRGTKVLCLKCGSPFRSWDRRKNRVCPRCAQANEMLLRVYTPEALDIERGASGGKPGS